MTDIIQVVRQFTEAVGCTTDQFNVRQTALYIGLQLEEMTEKLEALEWGGINHTGGDFTTLIIRLKQASLMFKSGELDVAIHGADRAAMLDADIDLAWVTIGSALSQGADVEGAAGEVARANLSKLVECDVCWDGNAAEGVSTLKNPNAKHVSCTKCNGTGLSAIKDANGKVKKPDGWTSPNIEPFVCKEKDSEHG